MYIGDSEVDIATAQNAGMNSIIVSWGFRETGFLKEQGAEVIVNQPKEVAKLILDGQTVTEDMGLEVEKDE